MVPHPADQSTACGRRCAIGIKNLIPKSLHIQANRHSRHAGLVLQRALILDVQNLMGQHPGSLRADLKAHSPLYKADRVQGPILLMHGVHDPRVKVTQSLQMAEALRARLQHGLIQGLV